MAKSTSKSKELADTLNAAKLSIRAAFAQADWWSLTQDEVRTKLDFVIDNIGDLGISFRDSFKNLCNLYNKSFDIRNKGKKELGAGVLFGNNLTEQEYQTSIRPVCAVLDLNDWTLPNEADVQSCRLLCDHINILDNFKVLKN